MALRRVEHPVEVGDKLAVYADDLSVAVKAYALQRLKKPYPRNIYSLDKLEILVD